jgi:hypothetical protein
MRRLFFICIVLCAYAFAHGQSGTCAQDVTVSEGQCGNSAGCSDIYPITWAGDPCDPWSGACVYFVWTTTSCCNIGGYPYLIESGNYCYFGMLKDPLKRKELVELAKNTPMLVPNCRGVYVPAEFVISSL